MKFSSPSIVFAVLMALEPPVFSQPEESPSPPTTARIIGELPDGTSPPPEPPKPKFIIPEEEILESQIHEQGGRKIVVQKISPIALPPPPTTEPTLDKTSPALQARIASLREKFPKNEMLRIGVTLYRSKNSTPRALCNYWPAATETPVTFWSSADVALLTSFCSFVGSDGETRSLVMGWSTLDIDGMDRLHEKLGIPYNAPNIPQLPDGKATFVIISGNTSAESLASIQSLHDLYNNEYDRLLTAYQGRERASAAREAELKAHPPKPTNIVLNYWDIGTDAPTQGGSK